VPRIAIGEPANLVVLDLEAEWSVAEDAFRSRSANSWLLGRTLVGAVVKTIAAGKVVFST
jgi:dihydroorotase